MSHTPSPRALERALLLETTVFREDITLERLRALLDQWEGENPPPPLDLERGWRRLIRARRRRTWGRPGRWVAAAGVALAVALPAGHLLGEAPAETPTAAWSPADYAPLYHFLGAHTLAVFDPLPRAELPNQGVLFQEPARLPADAQIQDGPYVPQTPEDGITEFYVDPQQEPP